MINAIKRFFEKNINPVPSQSLQDTDHRLRVATASLLIEVMRADHQYLAEECMEVTQSLRRHFDLSVQEVDELVQLAEQEVEHAVDHFAFTSLIKNEFNSEQKTRVIELMWQVAYADDHLEKYEEALIRKIADLIYVSHSNFIAAKHRVLNRNS